MLALRLRAGHRIALPRMRGSPATALGSDAFRTNGRRLVDAVSPRPRLSGAPRPREDADPVRGRFEAVRIRPWWPSAPRQSPRSPRPGDGGREAVEVAAGGDAHAIAAGFAEFGKEGCGGSISPITAERRTCRKNSDEVCGRTGPVLTAIFAHPPDLPCLALKAGCETKSLSAATALP